MHEGLAPYGVENSRIRDLILLKFENFSEAALFVDSSLERFPIWLTVHTACTPWTI